MHDDEIARVYVREEIVVPLAEWLRLLQIEEAATAMCKETDFWMAANDLRHLVREP